jgi:two-component system response regulator LytT
MKTKILLVEDEPELAENIKELIESLGYEVAGVAESTEDALIFLLDTRVDIAVVDIRIRGTRDGIELAKMISHNYGTPVVFSTAYSDSQTMERAKAVQPAGFLVKPYTRDALKATLFLAASQKPVTTTKTQETFEYENVGGIEHILLRDKGKLVRVKLDEIIYMKASGTYTYIFFEGKRMLVKKLLKEILPKLPEENFFRVHKSYIVNIHKIDFFNSKECHIMGQVVPVSRGIYRELAGKFSQAKKPL